MSRELDSAATDGSVSDDIAQYLSEAIGQGIFAIGSRLPTEHELARQFKVSRPVVREAIARVKADGLAISRRGSGLFVADLAARRSFRIAEGVGGVENTRILLELRHPIEVAASRLAAARRTAEDLQALVDAHQALISSTVLGEDGVLADSSFHHAIAVATHNRYYTDFMGYLGNVVQSSIRVARGDRNDTAIRHVTILEHETILDAIRSSDPERAAWAMSAHILGAHDRMVLENRADMTG